MLDFDHRNVLCLGDVMLDRYHYGRIERISPEAPVPVVRLSDTRAMLGGAGNVARNVASLGGTAVLIGVVGQDPAGREIAALIAATPGIVDATISSRLRPTICKSRVIAGHQHVVRLDEEATAPLCAVDTQATMERISDWVARCDVVVISDYAKGLLSDAVLDHVIEEARRHGRSVFVDPKRADFGAYRGATVLTPNLKELAAVSRGPVETEAQVAAAAQDLLKETGAAAVLVTRSEKGMMLVEAGGAVHAVAARAREVFDVSGAGDTAVAVTALATAAGHPLPEAVRLANAAAGIVVGKVGTATVDVEELRSALDLDAAQDEADGKFAHFAHACTQIEAWRRRGLRIGFTNGCFDILHRGHVSLLRRARASCDRLIVALNTDASVRRLKGPNRPVNALEDRCAVIAAVEAVDLVVAFDEDTPLELIRRLRPDVIFKGADYRPEDVVGADVVAAHGGHLALIDLVAGCSTTRILSRAAPLEAVRPAE